MWPWGDVASECCDYDVAISMTFVYLPQVYLLQAWREGVMSDGLRELCRKASGCYVRWLQGVMSDGLRNLIMPL